MSLPQYSWSTEHLAGAGRRYQGQFIDGLITLALFALCISVAKLFTLESQLADILIFVIPAAYFLLSDALPNGQSIGKIVLKISVVSKRTGKPCNVLQSLARNILTPILGIIDAVFILFNNRQRLGDMLANTIVVTKNRG